MTAIVAIDTETSGLDRRTREIWEVGLIRREPDGTEQEWQAFVGSGLDLSRASTESLHIGRFYERHPWHALGTARGPLLSERTVAHQVAMRLEGAHLVGAVPSFEDTGLFKLLDRYDLIPAAGRTPWHYHLVDSEALAAGALGVEPPWDSGALSRALGVEPERFERHTALGDARWALRLYDAAMARGTEAATLRARVAELERALARASRRDFAAEAAAAQRWADDGGAHHG
jgi:hypothetical protein